VDREIGFVGDDSQQQCGRWVASKGPPIVLRAERIATIRTHLKRSPVASCVYITDGVMYFWPPENVRRLRSTQESQRKHCVKYCFIPTGVVRFGMMDPVAATSHEPLSPRQQRFVEEYLIDRNGAAAYYRAFGRYNTDGSPKSEATGAVEASKLLSLPSVQAEVAAGESRLRAKRSVTAERVIDSYADFAFTDPTAAFAFDEQSRLVTVVPPHELPPEVRQLIIGIEVKNTRQGQSIKYTFASREKALEKLCKHLGLKAGDDTAADLLADLASRVARYKGESV
jgi:phage terminase small subunit